MKSYRCHQVVQAAKIIDITQREDPNPALFYADEEGRLVSVEIADAQFRDAAIGGYYVVYEDGYASYSPAEAFEKGYTEIIAYSTPHDVTVDNGPQAPAAAYEGGLPAGFSKIIASLKRVQSDLTEAQKAFVLGSPEWHDLETIDDKIHEALARLGD